VPRVSRLLPPLVIALGLLPSVWLLLKFPDTPQLGLLSDDVMYLGTAQSLATGNGYREAALAGNPWQTKYPPGYPAMLAPILKLNPPRLGFWIILHSFLWLIAASISLAWALAQTGLTRLQAAAAAALWTANPTAALIGTNALSEAPYCTFLFLATGWAIRAGTPRLAAFSGLLFGIASLIRSAGVVAAAGVFIWLLWRKGFRIAAPFAAFAVPLAAAWMAWSRLHLPTSHDPITEFYLNYAGRWIAAIRAAGLRQIVLKNLMYGTLGFGDLLIATQSMLGWRAVRDLALIALSAFAISEWDAGPFAASLISITAFQLIWHFVPDSRMLLPAAPAPIGAFVYWTRRWPMAPRAFILAWIAHADLQGAAALNQLYALDRRRDAALLPAYEYIVHSTSPDTILLGDEQIWWRTGRRIISMPVPMEYFYTNQGKATLAFLSRYREVAKQFGASFFLVRPWDLERSARNDGAAYFSAIHADSNLRLIYSQDGIELYMINASK
jgi:hypothetical protein